MFCTFISVTVIEATTKSEVYIVSL